MEEKPDMDVCCCPKFRAARSFCLTPPVRQSLLSFEAAVELGQALPQRHTRYHGQLEEFT